MLGEDIFFLFCLVLTYSGFAQDKIDPMAETIAQWFTMIEHSFIALADAMPADKYDFKPSTGEFENVRTFAEQVKHVACGISSYEWDRSPSQSE